MKFRNFDGLRIFDAVARCRSLTAAAADLCLTKSAISYQINKLESELGFTVFERGRNGVELTQKGDLLWHVAQANLSVIEECINELRGDKQWTLNIRLSTYFASRWLSPRLMDFMTQHPQVRITIEPAIDPGEFFTIHDTVAIRWGTGEWQGTHNEVLFHSMSIPVASPKVAIEAQTQGLDVFFANATLLQDAKQSQAWQRWFEESELQYSKAFEKLVIKDPNVRVRAVEDGQGVALYDQLVESELNKGSLVALSSLPLMGYGYYICYPLDALRQAPVRAFRDWILSQTVAGE